MNSAPSRTPLVENPWFWVHLFSAAALIGLLLIGPKAEQVQAQRDGNFTRRQRSLERQAAQQTQARTTVEASRTAHESAAFESVEEGDEAEGERYVSFAPFYLVLSFVMAGSWIMLWRQHFRRPTSRSTSPQGHA